MYNYDEGGDYMLEFFDDDNKIGNATIYDRHINFSSKLIPYFNDAYRVRIGIDKEKNELVIFMINKDYALSGEINETSLLPISVSKSYVRVSSKNLISFISESFNLNISQGENLSFKARYDDKLKAIVVNLGGK